MERNVRPLEDRLHAKTEPELNTGCLLWSGSTTHKGYGMIMVRKGYNRSTHRVAWEVANGRAIPDGLHVLHKCDTPACINPDHLWLGTNRDNARDSFAKGRQLVGAARKKPSNTKLSYAIAEEIRRSPLGARTLAAKYGIAHSLAYRIKTGKSWPVPATGKPLS
jgi:hypothetical protein